MHAKAHAKAKTAVKKHNAYGEYMKYMKKNKGVKGKNSMSYKEYMKMDHDKGK